MSLSITYELMYKLCCIIMYNKKKQKQIKANKTKRKEKREVENVNDKTSMFHKKMKSKRQPESFFPTITPFTEKQQILFKHNFHILQMSYNRTAQKKWKTSHFFNFYFIIHLLLILVKLNSLFHEQR